MKQSTAEKLIDIQNEYLNKTEQTTSRSILELGKKRRDKVTQLYKIPEDVNVRTAKDKDLLELADGITAELANKEGHRRMSINAQVKETVDRLRIAGYIHPVKSKASGNAKLQFLRDEEIVHKYNSVVRGLLN